MFLRQDHIQEITPACANLIPSAIYFCASGNLHPDPGTRPVFDDVINHQKYPMSNRHNRFFGSPAGLEAVILVLKIGSFFLDRRPRHLNHNGLQTDVFSRDFCRFSASRRFHCSRDIIHSMIPGLCPLEKYPEWGAISARISQLETSDIPAAFFIRFNND